MDPTWITAIAGAASLVGTGLGAVLTYILQHRKLSVSFETEERKTYLQDAAAFRKELRDEVERLYDRVAELEQRHEEDQRKVSRLERHVASLEGYITTLTNTLRQGGYSIPPRPIADD